MIGFVVRERNASDRSQRNAEAIWLHLLHPRGRPSTCTFVSYEERNSFWSLFSVLTTQMFQRLRIFSDKDILITMLFQSKHLFPLKLQILIEKEVLIVFSSYFFFGLWIWQIWRVLIKCETDAILRKKLINEGFRFEYGMKEMYDEMMEYFETNPWA